MRTENNDYVVTDSLEETSGHYKHAQDEIEKLGSANNGLEKKVKELSEDLSGSKSACDNMSSLNSELNVQLSG